jgi:hypothetical protein
VVKFMALRWLVVVGLLGTFSGCFNPRVKNLGFACNATDPSPCPGGFQCLNGFCDDGSGGPRPSGGSPDMSHAAPANDLAMTPPAQSVDMAQLQTIMDLAQPQTIVDMAQAPMPDLAKPTCQPLNAPCTSYKDCCSGHCHSLSTLVCF